MKHVMLLMTTKQQAYTFVPVHTGR